MKGSKVKELAGAIVVTLVMSIIVPLAFHASGAGKHDSAAAEVAARPAPPLVAAATVAAAATPTQASTAVLTQVAGSQSPGSAASTVTIEVSEFRLVASAARGAAGGLTLRLQNKGQVAHELKVVQSTLEADKLPDRRAHV